MSPALAVGIRLIELKELIMRGRHRTDIEVMMADALKDNGIEAVEQFPIRGRFGYSLDFAIPELKIDIECDGEHFHKEGNSRDRKRNWVLREYGWTVIRFRGNEIRENIQNCINKIKTTINKLKGGVATDGES